MTTKEAEIIIKLMKPEFDSHDFIFEFINQFPSSYGKLLIKHNSATTANAEIANNLRNNSSELNILKIGEVESVNIYGHLTICALWRKESSNQSNQKFHEI
ncbi:MAG: hypothetical protein K2M79_03715 [Muribaculaceae bacterium]|nr:hypothetical protein [Muribaculaceae bacterium]